MPATFRCTVVTPEQKLLEVDARYASLPAWDGQVGIAPGRAPLLVKLGLGRLRIEVEGGEEQRYYVGGGFAQMKGGVLSILADEARPVGEIDRPAVERELSEHRAKLVPAGPEMEQRDRTTERARAKLAATR